MSLKNMYEMPQHKWKTSHLCLIIYPSEGSWVSFILDLNLFSSNAAVFVMLLIWPFCEMCSVFHEYRTINTEYVMMIANSIIKIFLRCFYLQCYNFKNVLQFNNYFIPISKFPYHLNFSKLDIEIFYVLIERYWIFFLNEFDDELQQ